MALAHQTFGFCKIVQLPKIREVDHLLRKLGIPAILYTAFSIDPVERTPSSWGYSSPPGIDFETGQQILSRPIILNSSRTLSVPTKEEMKSARSVVFRGGKSCRRPCCHKLFPVRPTLQICSATGYEFDCLKADRDLCVPGRFQIEPGQASRRRNTVRLAVAVLHGIV
jgi:hypothetical protein